jgi:hypothetical protein
VCLRACALVWQGRHSLTVASVRTRVGRGKQRVSTPRVYAFTFVQTSVVWPLRRHETDGACTATTYVAEPLKLIPYYCLNHSSWPLSNNIEVTYRLCRVKPGKSLTSQDRQLYIKTHMKASLEITSHKSLHNIIQRFIITNQVFIIKVNSSDSKHSGNKVLIDISNITRGHL